MKLIITGTRGIPARYGGFETFAEEISVLLVQNGIDVTIQCDNGSFSSDEYKGVKLWSPSVTKSKNPVRYYYEGLKHALKNYDIILAASCAGSAFYILNIFRNKIIITNPDGLEHKRKKWGWAGRLYLSLSELIAVNLTDYLVADSKYIKEYLENKYSNAVGKTRVIEYGAYPNSGYDQKVLDKYDLENNRYYLVVGRLEPENNIDMILGGYSQSRTECPLIIIGNILDTPYVKNLVSKFSSEKIRFLGGIYDRDELNSIRYSCKAYIHGHSVGGTNPSLLEAMASSNIVIAHDNIFNRDVTSDSQLYFSSSYECTERVNEVEKMTPGLINRFKDQSITTVAEKYNWQKILSKYLDLFREIENNTNS